MVEIGATVGRSFVTAHRKMNALSGLSLANGHDWNAIATEASPLPLTSERRRRRVRPGDIPKHLRHGHQEYGRQHRPDVRSVTVTCNPGDKVLSGGIDELNESTNLRTSSPSNSDVGSNLPNEWIVSWYHDGTS